MRDKIFLLSKEEYENYKDKIPHINIFDTWLRTAGKGTNAAIIDRHGAVVEFGTYVGFECGAVRPALRINPDEWFFDVEDESKLICCGVTWLQIDEGLYIAEVPIAFRRFDEKNNNYTTSEIRQFLLNWYNERKGW